jgi:hypothetical protein
MGEKFTEVEIRKIFLGFLSARMDAEETMSHTSVNYTCSFLCLLHKVSVYHLKTRALVSDYLQVLSQPPFDAVTLGR